MAEYKNDKIALFIFENENRSNERQPTHQGNAEISKDALRLIIEAMKATNEDVVKLDVAIWPKVARSGKAYQFGIVGVKDPKFAKPEEHQEQAGSVDDLDEIPF